jgi:hypothetical protein
LPPGLIAWTLRISTKAHQPNKIQQLEYKTAICLLHVHSLKGKTHASSTKLHLLDPSMGNIKSSHIQDVVSQLLVDFEYVGQRDIEIIYNLGFKESN